MDKDTSRWDSESATGMEVNDMARTVSIGAQDFAKLAKENLFLVDKTDFSREWGKNQDRVTLIPRPRRFGKTLNINMVDRFFSNLCDDQEELFGHLKIWQDETMRALAGQYPVVSLSFADIKETTFEEAKEQIFDKIYTLFADHEYLYTRVRQC